MAADPPAVAAQAPVRPGSSTRTAGHGVAKAATLVAGLTVVSRAAGFGRTLVFVWAVGAMELGAIYQTANTVPNIIFEIVAGGAMASLVVPTVAGALARGDDRAVGATVSALLTWALTLLVPAAVLLALAAGPIVRLLDANAAPQTVAVGVDMLRVFAPQLPLYGVGIVITGVLHTYRRFAWPVIAPLLSSVVVIGAYFTFVTVAGRQPPIGQVGTGGVLILSIGTTLGVVALSLCLLFPLRRLRLRLRPTYRFDATASRAVRQLAVAGALTVGVQQLGLAVAMALANGGPRGSFVLYGLAQTIYLLPWAILALPIATSAYPALAQAAANGDRAGYAAVLAPVTRGLLLFGCLGAAALGALAAPLARLLAGTTAGPESVGVVAAAVAGFAPGLVGYGLFALLSRALYARGDMYPAAAATVAGWVAVALASLAMAAAVPHAHRVAALTAANSVGMLVLGGALLALVRRQAGAQALSGAVRAGAAGVLAGLAAVSAAIGVRHLVWGSATPGAAGALLQGMLCGCVVGGVFLGVAYAVDRRDVRPVLAALARRLGVDASG
jgi:putative peptidoglycan lipid II flippase